MQKDYDRPGIRHVVMDRYNVQPVRAKGLECRSHFSLQHGDIAMLETEVTPTLKALRSHGLDVVAIHHHMTNSRPVIIFLHYWGRGPADKLATGFKAGLDELGKGNK